MAIITDAHSDFTAYALSAAVKARDVVVPRGHDVYWKARRLPECDQWMTADPMESGTGTPVHVEMETRAP